MTTYSSLEQRIAAGYLEQFPAFVPAGDAPVSAGEQRAFYELMKSLYQLLRDEPALFAPALHGDDAFPTRYKTGYGKPELQANVSKGRRAINSLLACMYQMGRSEAVRLSRRQRHILSALGVGDAAGLPPAWRWMAARPGADPVAFAYCRFDPSHVYSAEVYGRLLGAGAFRQLEVWMLSQGYRAYDLYHTDYVDFQLTLTYANPAWDAARPNQGFEYKIRHTGIAAQYDICVRNPVSVGLCIPGGLKFFLERFSAMDQGLQDFVLGRTKACDGCRYCVQTDKTGRRPLAAVPVSHRGASHKLCPYFPGYTFSWDRLDPERVSPMIDFMAFMDRFAGKKA